MKRIRKSRTAPAVSRRRATPRWLLLAAIAMLLAGHSDGPDTVAIAQTGVPCQLGDNDIACENRQPGAPPSEWDIVGSGDSNIQGFATDISVPRNGTVRFKIKSPLAQVIDPTTGATVSAPGDYRIRIYRLGYYGGQGARRIATIPSDEQLTLPGQTQPACVTPADGTGLIDCGNWAESTSWVVPSDVVSGIYIAKLTRADVAAGASHIVFIVRDDIVNPSTGAVTPGQSDLLFQTSDTTWQAYNGFGGNSLYTGNGAVGRAYMVSYNRPFATRGSSSGDWLFSAEYPMVRWLERNGFDVSYIAGVDTDRLGAQLFATPLRHKAFLSVGHDEYWSGQQRTNVEAARNAGMHLAFFSGNEVFWKTRWEASVDGSAAPYRTLVTYKETHANAKIDPLQNVWTGTWRDPRFSPPADGGRPENALTGQLFTANDQGQNFAIKVPHAEGQMRFWRNTTIATALQPGQTATLAGGTLGYEWDEDVDNGARPAGLFRVSSTIQSAPLLVDHGSNYAQALGTHSMTLYRHVNGPVSPLVFGAGTVQWAWGLDGTHDRGGPEGVGSACTPTTCPPDVRVQQATVNLLADMDVQPVTPSGVSPAVASTDTTSPTSAITFPPAGALIDMDTQVTITGTALDAGGGRVGGVEVSIDGGTSWHAAVGRDAWSYTFTPRTAGSLTIRSRAVDDSGWLEDLATAPSMSVTIRTESVPPTVLTTSPSVSAFGVSTGARVTATFDEPMNAATINGTTFELRDASSTLVPATVAYDNVSNRAILTLSPTSARLANSTQYTARIKGGTGGVTDANGNALVQDFVWVFTTSAAPAGSLTQGPGGPVLVITNGSNKFSTYYAEILRAEGLNVFETREIGLIDGTTLAAYDVVILGEMTLTPAQVTMFTDWVTGGGNLVAMRPDKQLYPLLGLTDVGTTLANAYLLINSASGPGLGLVGLTIQFHGIADRATLNGASSLATLYADATTATAQPAVTLRSVGANGGQAAAFLFDLARSVVYTRQGNPAWQGQERDGTFPVRSNDLFFGNKAGDPQPDWIDLNKVAIPQADEQQRLLANLILQVNADRKPLPRFWYFPRGEKAVVVMTGDDHKNGGTNDRFNQYKSFGPPGCSVDDWECVRSTSYVYVDTPFAPGEAAQFVDEGFEIGLHVNPAGINTMTCAQWDAINLPAVYADQLAQWALSYPGLPAPRTNRTHCISVGDWASQPKEEFNRGIRFDTNYYYWPGSWVQNRPGMFTGSGMPMRFADLDGTTIDVYQGTSQMTDESQQGYPLTPNTLLDRATGPEGFYGAFTANMHTDLPLSGESDNIVASARARGVPIVSAKQMLDWLDGRNGSAFGAITWDAFAQTLGFSVSVAAGANGLEAMLPNRSGTRLLTSLTRGGSPVAFRIETIKGMEYAIFTARPGSYVATYPSDSVAPVISGVGHSTPNSSTAVITWSTNEPASSLLAYGGSPSLGSSASDPTLRISHSFTLTGLSPSTTYHYRVTSVDAAGNSATAPTGGATFTFTTPTLSFADTTVAHFGAGNAGQPATGTYIAETVDGEVTLAPAATGVATEFSGSAIPAGWEVVEWQAGGIGQVGGGVLLVDGARVNTTALYTAGHTFESVVTFASDAFQHAGFAVSFAAGEPFAIFSTKNGNGELWIRTTSPAGTFENQLAGNLTGVPHRFRVDWNPAGIDYYIDGNVVGSHPIAAGIQMRPLAASDFNLCCGNITVNWLRMAPYVGSGTFQSRIFDAFGPANWGALSWTGDTPAGTTLAMHVRAGNTPIPDASWTAFAPVLTSGSDVSLVGWRYFQYQAELATTDPQRAPTLSDVTIGYRANVPPVANNDASTTSEDVELQVLVPGVLWNDTDANGDPLTAVIATGPAHGAVTLNTDGSFTYMPQPNFNGIDSFTYTAQDATLSSNVATVTITVNAVNDAPVAVNDVFTTGEDVPLIVAASGVLANDTDVEGSALTAVRVAGPTNGTLTLNANGSFSYTPNLNFSGTDSFTYRANDGTVNSANAATVTITVLPANDPPAAVNDTATTTQNTAVDINVRANDTDPDGDPLTVSSVTQGTNGTVAINADGTVKYTPNLNFSGTDTFTYKVKDAAALESNPAVVGVTVNSEQTSGAIPPQGGTVSTDDGVPGATNVDSVETTVTSPTGGTVTIVETTTTEPSTDPGYTFLDQQINITVDSQTPATAANPLVLTFTLDASIVPAGENEQTLQVFRNGVLVASCDLAAGTSAIPDPCVAARTLLHGGEQEGDIQLTIRTSAASRWNVAKKRGNTAPVAADDIASVTADGTLTVAKPGVLANDTDADGNTLIAVQTSGPTNGTLTLSANGSFTYSPNLNFTGTDSFTYRANDGRVDSNIATVTITVRPLPRITISDAPLVTEGNLGTTAAANFTVSLSEASDRPITVAFATADGTATAGADYTASSGTLTFAVGETTKTVTVTVTGDALDETNETFFVNLSGASNATIADGQGVGTITDDDSAPALTISDVSVTEGNVGTVNATFTVTLSAASGQTVTVNYATANGTATAGATADYVAGSGTVTFAPGQTSQPVTVVVNGDTLDEANETFTVGLSLPSNATIATGGGTGTGTITDDDATPTLAINNASVTEGNTGTVNATFTVTLSAQSGQTVKVDYATANGTATAGATADYVATSGKLTFTPGQTTQSITVVVNGDTLDEANETFTVGLSLPSNATILTGTGTGTITDDDATPTLAINDVTVTEGNTGTVNAIFTVTLSAVSGQTVTVNYATANGTATAGATADYVAGSGTLIFTPGQTTQSITVAVNGDTVDEADETFTVGLSLPSNATILTGTGTGTIIDDDTPPPTLSIGDATVTEGDAAAVNATFTVTLSAASSQTVTVSYATADGTAKAPGDYAVIAPTSLTFAAGETTKSVTVVVAGDLADEPNETFVVNLSGATNATIADGQATGTITDNDATPTLAINTATVTEGNTGTVNATFTVTLSAASGQTVTVDYATANGTATAGATADYMATSGKLTFTPGQTTQSITVVVNGDMLDEANETFTVGLSLPSNATILTGTGTGTITDDDATPTLAINDVTVTEGNTGTVNATFTVTLSAASGRTVTVNYATANGTATAGATADYLAGSGTLTFTPGQTTQSITVVVNGDTLDEANETFTVGLSTPGNATILDGSGLGTITDDDATPTLAINDVTVTEGNTGTVNAIFTVTLSAASGQTVTVNYATANGTATAGATADYLAGSGTLTFTPGQTTQSITVVVNGDTLDEANETFTVGLSIPGNATILDGSGLGTITNDDTPPPTLAINDVTVTEGDAATVSATFTVTLSAASAQTVTVNYATANGTATAPADYTAVPVTGLTFAAGETTKSVTVVVAGDLLDEANETFVVNLSGAANATIADTQGTGTITDNDATPTLAINDVTVTEGDTGTVNATFTVTLSAASGQTVTVSYATADGTAQAPADYTAIALTGLTFAPGATTKSVIVVVAGDLVDEPNETFVVNLSGASNATIADGQGTGTITDNDPTAVNNAPVANNQSVSTPQNTSKPITLTASDANNDPLTYTVVANPTHGTLTGTAPNLTYAPTAGYTGPDSFTFKANDGKVDSNVATVSITVESAGSITFRGSGVNSGTGTALGAEATFSFDPATLNLTVVVKNTSGADVLAASDVLTAVFFTVKNNPSLTPVSAMIPVGTVSFGPDGGGNVGGEWAYAGSIAGPNLANKGVSTVTLGIFGSGNLRGLNLEGLLSVENHNYGITSAGDNTTTGDAAVTGAEPLIKNSVTIRLKSGVVLDPKTAISNVSFQYGTSITANPNLPGS